MQHKKLMGDCSFADVSYVSGADSDDLGSDNNLQQPDWYAGWVQL